MIGDIEVDSLAPDLGAEHSGADGSEIRVIPSRVQVRRLALQASDLAVIAAAVAAVGLAVGVSLLGATVSVACFGIAVQIAGLYRGRLITGFVDELRRVSAAVAIGAGSIALVGVLSDLTPARLWLGATSASTWFGLVAARGVWRYYFRSRRGAGTVSRPTVLVGANPEAEMIAEMVEGAPVLGYTLVDRVDPTIDSSGELLTTRVLSSVNRHGADTALVCGSGVEFHALNRICRDLRDAGVNVELSMGLVDVAHRRLTLRPIGRFPVTYLEPVHRSGIQLQTKRAIDVVASAIGLVILAPVFALAALSIRATSSGPVIFRQERVGRDGRNFTMFKFRTMVAEAEDLLADLRVERGVEGPLFKLRDDPRVTQVGRWLRRTSLDEIPQLVNVLRGDMSLVGPRPALRSEMAAWPPELYARLRVRPGITGLWQVSGRSEAGFDEYTRLDLYYVDNWSLLGDLGILARTAAAVVRSAGAY